MKPEYRTADIYCAAALDCLGIAYLRAEVQGGQTAFVFSNTDDTAWKTAMEYRTDGWMMVPVLRFKDSFRFLSRESRMARQAMYAHEDQHDEDFPTRD